MSRGPARLTTGNIGSLALRDPINSLNYTELLRVCGTATNAFVNLATSSGLRSRRLLLLSPHREAKHVVAEVWLHGRWAVVDPAYHALFRDANGEFLTKEQLQNPSALRKATQEILHYPPSYSYELTSYVRVARIPVIGSKLHAALDQMLPRWQGNFDWLLLERQSFACFVLSLFLLLIAIA